LSTKNVIGTNHTVCILIAHKPILMGSVILCQLAEFARFS